MSGGRGQRCKIAKEISSEDGDERDGDGAGEIGDEDHAVTDEADLVELGSPLNSSDDELCWNMEPGKRDRDYGEGTGPVGIRRSGGTTQLIPSLAKTCTG